MKKQKIEILVVEDDVKKRDVVLDCLEGWDMGMFDIKCTAIGLSEFPNLVKNNTLPNFYCIAFTNYTHAVLLLRFIPENTIVLISRIEDNEPRELIFVPFHESIPTKIPGKRLMLFEQRVENVEIGGRKT